MAKRKKVTKGALIRRRRGSTGTFLEWAYSAEATGNLSMWLAGMGSGFAVPFALSASQLTTPFVVAPFEMLGGSVWNYNTSSLGQKAFSSGLFWGGSLWLTLVVLKALGLNPDAK